MLNHARWFVSGGRKAAVLLPFALEKVIGEWQDLRNEMRRSHDRRFTRDEWAYLITFLGQDRLWRVVERTFGAPSADAAGTERVFRPRGTVGVWLPNNVSLLGPLILTLLSLTGNRLRVKGGSRSEDLAGAFLEFALSRLGPGALRRYLEAAVEYAAFDRHDPRHRAMMEASDVRIVFGGDEAARAIASEPARPGALQVTFRDRQSQAWIDTESATDGVLSELIRVFAIYGRAGCTSPRRCLVIDGNQNMALSIRDRLAALWPAVVRRRPEAHIASSNTLARQWSDAAGWDSRIVGDSLGVVACGPATLEPVDTPMFLPVCPASGEEAIAALPSSIQTIGHALAPARKRLLMEASTTTGVSRIVKLARMHDFGASWDGQDYWRQCFEEVECEL